LEWVQGNTAIEEAPAATLPVVRAASETLSGLRMELKLSSDGEYLGLRNAAEVRTAVAKAAEVVVRHSAAAVPASYREQFIRTLSKMMPPERLINSAAKDVSIYFGLSGVELESGKPVRTQLETPNPLGGGDKLRSDVEIALRSIDPGEARLSYSQRYDSHALAGMMSSFVRQLPRKPLARSELPKIELVDQADYTLDLNTGWMKRVHHTRTTTAGDVLRRTDTTDITLKLGH
jgi:hypothetical protein